MHKIASLLKKNSEGACPPAQQAPFCTFAAHLLNFDVQYFLLIPPSPAWSFSIIQPPPNHTPYHTKQTILNDLLNTFFFKSAYFSDLIIQF